MATRVHTMAVIHIALLALRWFFVIPKFENNLMLKYFVDSAKPRTTYA